MRYSLTLLIAILLAAVTVRAQEKSGDPAKPASAKSGGDLDDALFDELKGLTDDLLPDDPAAEPKEPQPNQPGTGGRRPLDDVDRELLGDLNDGAVEDQSSPLGRVAARMREVESRIGSTDSGAETQTLQDKIVADLTELLKQKQQQQQSQSPQQSPSNSQQSRRETPNPKDQQPKQGEQPQQAGNQPQQAGNQPARDSEEGVREADNAQPELGDELADQIRAIWGHLPEHQRERMVQAFKEKYLQQYEDLIKQYYTRLAEQKR